MKVRLTSTIQDRYVAHHEGDVGEVTDWFSDDNGNAEYFRVIFYGRPGLFDIRVEDLERL